MWWTVPCGCVHVLFAFIGVGVRVYLCACACVRICVQKQLRGAGFISAF